MKLADSPRQPPQGEIQQPKRKRANNRAAERPDTANQHNPKNQKPATPNLLWMG